MGHLLTTFLFAIGVTAIFKVNQWAAAKSVDREGNYREVWKQARYQPLMLLVAVGLVTINRFAVAPFTTVTNVGVLDAASEGFDWMGLPTGTSWTEVGWTFTLVPMAVTGLVVYLQTLHRKPIEWRALPAAFGLALVFSFTNSAVEELIFRVLLIEGWAPYFDFAVLALVSGLAFGIPHYFGNPGKLPGVVMASFLGWVLARSILDTGGMAWAWAIHFAQDVPIFTILLLLDAANRRSARVGQD